MKSSRQQMVDATPDNFLPGDCSPQVKLWRIKRLSLYRINILKPGGK
ncbi:MAG: hypothetical protein J7527_05060 [Chitinophagaceae bacterium]|nr:hypothetical protein [Chitinophagaceae bacterium]